MRVVAASLNNTVTVFYVKDGQPNPSVDLALSQPDKVVALEADQITMVPEGFWIKDEIESTFIPMQHVLYATKL